jgi:wyosine [tRNA(Phe)-imidazoG37] synthetase (radical SAM superfamily)
MNQINRPASKVDCTELIDSLAEFHKASKAKFFLEIFVLPGVNDTAESLNALASAVKKINPDNFETKIQNKSISC